MKESKEKSKNQSPSLSSTESNAQKDQEKSKTSSTSSSSASSPDSKQNTKEQDDVAVETVSELNLSTREKFGSIASVAELNSKLETVMQACTQSFKELFCKVFMQGILRKQPRELQAYIKTLYTSTSFWDMQSSQESSEGDDLYGLTGWDRGKHFSTKIRLGMLSEDVINAFRSGCHLLMEFSSFPLYCWNSQKLLQDSYSKGKINGKTSPMIYVKKMWSTSFF